MARVLSPSDYVSTPWKNGRGTTTEIAREPLGGGGSFDFDWRISVAPVVKDGPFSLFPGIDRTILVLNGAGMDLTIGTEPPLRLFPLQPFTFDGGTHVDGSLIAGPVRDFNVMVRRGAWKTSVTVLSEREQFKLPHRRSGLLLLYVAEGIWRGKSRGLPDIDLVAQQTLRLAGNEAAGCVFEGSGSVIVVRLARAAE